MRRILSIDDQWIKLCQICHLPWARIYRTYGSRMLPRGTHDLWHYLYHFVVLPCHHPWRRRRAQLLWVALCPLEGTLILAGTFAFGICDFVTLVISKNLASNLLRYEDRVFYALHYQIVQFGDQDETNWGYATTYNSCHSCWKFFVLIFP